MAVILEGLGPEAKNRDVQVAATYLMSMLEELAETLDNSALENNEISNLLQHAYLKLEQTLSGHPTAVAFSATVVFRNQQGLLKSLSFGMGNTLIALDNQIEVETVLAAQSSSDSSIMPCLPYPHRENTSPESPLRYLQIDIRSLKPNDRFLFLTDGAYNHLELEKQEEEEKRSPGDGTPCISIRTYLKARSIPTQYNCYDLAEKAQNQTNTDFQSLASRSTVTLGDELTLAEVMVPDEEQQQALQDFFYNKAKMKLEKTLSELALPDPLRQKFTAIKEKIVQLRNLGSPDLPNLTKALLKTTDVLQKREDGMAINHYLHYAKEQVSGKISFLWKTLGVVMHAAALLLAVLGGLVIAGSLGLGAGAGAGFFPGGMGLIGFGTFFYKQGRKRDLQTEMLAAGKMCLNPRAC